VGLHSQQTSARTRPARTTPRQYVRRHASWRTGPTGAAAGSFDWGSLQRLAEEHPARVRDGDHRERSHIRVHPVRLQPGVQERHLPELGATGEQLWWHFLLSMVPCKLLPRAVQHADAVLQRGARGDDDGESPVPRGQLDVLSVY
jgi:hypothetical protein